MKKIILLVFLIHAIAGCETIYYNGFQQGYNQGYDNGYKQAVIDSAKYPEAFKDYNQKNHDDYIQGYKDGQLNRGLKP